MRRIGAKHLDLHLIVDNYTTHKTKEVQAWLKKHPRFKLHFIPTSSSWLNLVERSFAQLTGKRIRAASSRESRSWRLSSLTTLQSTMPIPNPLAIKLALVVCHNFGTWCHITCGQDQLVWTQVYWGG